MISQNTIEAPRIVAQNEPHLACVLLLDTSGSMSGEPIANLTRAINSFKDKVAKDELARKRVDLAIITFDDSPILVQDFKPICQMDSIDLTTGGVTNMGEAINFAIDKVKERNRFYASVGTPCFRPWIFMISDGAPTDDIDSAAQRIREEEAKGQYGKLKFWALGVQGYSKATLCKLTKRVMALDDTNFDGIFNWLSESMVTISVSRVTEEVPITALLPSNAKIVPSDW